MKSKTQNPKPKTQNLVIEIEGGGAVLRWGGRTAQAALRSQSLLAGIARVAGDPRSIKAIKARIDSATFSATRQIVAVVNTLAWVLGVKVNGKRQMAAQYDREPNITV